MEQFWHQSASVLSSIQLRQRLRLWRVSDDGSVSWLLLLKWTESSNAIDALIFQWKSGTASDFFMGMSSIGQTLIYAPVCRMPLHQQKVEHDSEILWFA